MAKASLFVTCLVDLFEPTTAQSACSVLQRHGWAVAVPSEQTCCGQFAYNAGHWEEAQGMAQHFIDAFESEDADVIVSLSGSCAAMVIHEYPTLLREMGEKQGQSADDTESWILRARVLGHKMLEFGEWLRQEAPLELPGVKPEQVAVHHGCHMRRVLRATQPSDEVLASLGAIATDYPDQDQCCGFGGTYSMNEPVVSTALADAKRTALEQARLAGAQCLVSGDWGCLLHLAGRMEKKKDPWTVRHIAEWVNDREKMSAKKGE